MTGADLAEQDELTQSAVLHLLLDLHPASLTVAELLREMTPATAGFAERDAVERAVRDLISAGLLNRSGDLVLPSRAAVRFHELAAR